MDKAVEKIELLKEPALCYVKGNRAYFTTCPLEHQWGDDWNDAPYEHNAGMPYYWHPYQLEKYGMPEYQIITIMWEGALETPADYHFNSPYSVDMINRGDVAWLRPDEFDAREGAKPIMAGVTPDKFKRLVWLAGGDIYERVVPPEGLE